MDCRAADRRLGDQDYRRLLGFRSELRGFMRWSEEAARDAGLTPSLHQLLLVIRGHTSLAGQRSARRPTSSRSATTAPSSSPSGERPRASCQGFVTQATIAAFILRSLTEAANSSRF